MSETILKIENLVKHFPTGKGKRGEKEVVKAVDGISFELKAGETIGLVGESGCGKTTAGRTILKLVEPTSGKIIFEDKDITDYSSSKMRAIRAQMQIIFQDPYSALNPRQTIGKIISAPFEIQGITPPRGHQGCCSKFDGARWFKPRALQPLSARILWRTTPAHWYRTCDCTEAKIYRCR